jgi:CO dehydrogenase/acetyl-CoA synthase beta subunit
VCISFVSLDFSTPAILLKRKEEEEEEEEEEEKERETKNRLLNQILKEITWKSHALSEKTSVRLLLY